MFAYVLIVLEITFLCTVFWYAFVREPKPFEIKEDIWGYYPDQESNTINGINSHKASGARRIRKIHSSEALLRSARHGVKRKVAHVQSDIKNGWSIVEDETKPTTLLATLLAFIGKQLTQLSVRLS